MNFVIVHFNTPELTACLCKSIKKFHPSSRIFMFDNSDKIPFKYAPLLCNEYYDNTAGTLINFDAELKKYDVDKGVYKLNKCGSAKHCISIQWLLDNLPVDDCVLLDSDVLLTRAFTWKTMAPIVGEHEKFPGQKDRLLPFICYLNLKEIRDRKLRYFDAARMNGLSAPGAPYDTGASFLEDIIAKHVPMERIRCNSFVVHFKNGSWGTKNAKEWLVANKHCWL